MVQSPKAPVLPPELAAMKFPAGAVDAAGRRTVDQIKGMPSTILTSSSGVLNAAPTEKKTLLGA
jgi:hypothetical protein